MHRSGRTAAQEAARFPVGAKVMPPSKTVIDRVTADKQTFWKVDQRQAAADASVVLRQLATVVAAPILALASLGRFPWWAAVIIVVRELLVSALRVVLGLRGRSLPASRGAKVKTTLQILAITLYILPLGSSWHGIRFGLLVAAVVATVLTGIQYVVRAVPWLRRVRPGPPAKPEAAA